MALWKGQTGETLISFSVIMGGDNRVTVAIDKVGLIYRATIGDLFDFREIMWSKDLEQMLVELHTVCQAERESTAKKLINDMAAKYPKPDCLI